MVVGYIYVIQNKITQRIYIGQTSEQIVEKRWNSHIKELKRNVHGNDFLQNSWNKYGEESFIFFVIQKISEDNYDELIKKLNCLEIIYISIFKAKYNENGFNIRDGGQNSKLDEITKRKISEKKKGKMHTEETKKKISYALKGENNPFYNKNHTTITRNKISKSNIGKTRTNEMIEKMKITHGAENNGMFNKKHTEETKRKMSLKAIGRKKSKETIEKTKETLYNKNKKKLKISEVDIVSIYIEIINGTKGTQLAEKYNISNKIVSNIKNKIGIYGKIIDEYYFY